MSKNREKINESANKLFRDYLKLCDSYKDELEPQIFSYLMLKFVYGMMIELAPSVKEMKEIIKISFEDAIKEYNEGETNEENI